MLPDCDNSWARVDKSRESWSAAGRAALEWLPAGFSSAGAITWMSRSRIFLRSVLRLTPSSSAARIWLPRVAASAAESSGYSTSRRMR